MADTQEKVVADTAVENAKEVGVALNLNYVLSSRASLETDVACIYV